MSDSDLEEGELPVEAGECRDNGGAAAAPPAAPGASTGAPAVALPPPPSGRGPLPHPERLHHITAAAPGPPPGGGPPSCFPPHPHGGGGHAPGARPRGSGGLPPPPPAAGGGGGAGAAKDRGASPRDAEREKAEKEQREQKELTAELQKATAKLSFNEVRSNFDPACAELKGAIKKLDKLLRRVRKKKHDDISLYPPCDEFSRRIHGGLKHALALCGTGYGKSNVEGVRALMKTAVNYRHEVFAPAPKKELEGLIRESREFRYLFESRDKDGRIVVPEAAPPATPSSAPAAAAAGPGPSPAAAPGGAAAAAAAEGSCGEGGPQASVSRGEAPSEGSRAPPLPADSVGGPAASPAAGGGGGSGSAAAGPAAAAAGAAPGGGGGLIRIVVSSSIDALAAGDGGAADSGGGAPGAFAKRGPDSAAAGAYAKRPRPDVSPCSPAPEGPLPGPPPLPPGPPPAGEAAAAAAAAAAADGRDPLGALMRARRLALVIDLDHVLLSTWQFADLDPEAERQLQDLLAQQPANPEQRDLFRLPRAASWAKLRPGARDFLRCASERFELWARAAGDRRRGEALLEALGPAAAAAFGGRLLAGGGGGSGGAAAEWERQVGEREPLAVALGEAGAPWTRDGASLLAVERYCFFPHPRLRGRGCLFELGRDECPRGGMLAALGPLLDGIHAQVFDRIGARAPRDAWDVRAVMDARRRRVLSGAHLAFTRLAPAGADPRAHPLWRLAERFGAAVSDAPGEATTHVVAVQGGTEKALWARDHGRFLVTPAWLECSCTLWRRAEEGRFAAW